MLEPCIETLEMVLNFDWIMAMKTIKTHFWF